MVARAKCIPLTAEKVRFARANLEARARAGEGLLQQGREAAAAEPVWVCRLRLRLSWCS
jgi:hypothetical protein